MRIQRLSPLLANQIAAGEVIERPASVVKELLENSLDANAQHIKIDIDKGGCQLIRIRDDGVGIHGDDLPLAVGSHATSKIATLDDLTAIASLGFRGEALASICAVAKVSMQSCPRQSDEAQMITVAGSSTDYDIQPTSHPCGTTIEVRELFFNTPVRRKFLRNDKTEFSHIETVVKRMALSRFDCAFILKHNQKVLFNFPQAHDDIAKEKRVVKLFGQAFMQQARVLDTSASGMHLSGWIGLPSFLRSQTDLQYFYINGRMVRDKLINHAIRSAYQDSLYAGRHPAYLLYLDIDPQELDVNVHPTKHEVRFHQARLVHDFISRRLQQALHENEIGEDETPIGRPYCPPVGQQEFETTPILTIAQPAATYQSTTASMDTAMLPLAEPPMAPVKSHPFGCVIGVYQQKFLLSEHAQGLAVIDICAAQQTLFKKQYIQARDKQQFNWQPLLIPQRIPLDNQRVERLLQHKKLLFSLGLSLDRVSEEVMVIRDVPRLLRDADWLTICEAIADFMATSDDRDALVNIIVTHAVTHADVPVSVLEQNAWLQILADELNESEHESFVRILQLENT